MEPGSPVRFVYDDEAFPQSLLGATSEYPNVNGTLAYNSFYTQRVLLDDPDASECKRGNDFALIEMPLEAQSLVTPYWRTGDLVTHILEPTEIHVGDQVIAYGHSALWLNQDHLHEKRGVVSGEPVEAGDYWWVLTSTVTPGIFGDSGSPVITPDGEVVGVIITAPSAYHGGIDDGNGGIQPPSTMPSAGTNIVLTLHRALEYMESHTDLRVVLAEP
jgi:hypothetical protein